MRSPATLVCAALFLVVDPAAEPGDYVVTNSAGDEYVLTIAGDSE